MRKGTWLRPLSVPPANPAMRAHYLPGHTLNTPVAADEQTRCHKRAIEIGPGAMFQDWRVPWGSAWTCQDCVKGLREDDA